MSASEDSDATEVPRGRDSAGFEWEEISPSPVESAAPSKEQEQLRPPKPAAEPQELCGYLHKLTVKGLIKIWKTRWFVFDDNRCCLYYYNNKDDPSPAGFINIAKASFSYNVENSSKNQFEIVANNRVSSLQATSREAMTFWLETLQKKRRKFSIRRKNIECTNHQGGKVTNGGLVAEKEEEEEGEEEEGLGDILPDAPIDLEDRSVFEKARGTSSSNATGGGGGLATSGRWLRNINQRLQLRYASSKAPLAPAQSLSPTASRRSQFYMEPTIPERDAGTELSPEGTADVMATQQTSEQLQMRQSKAQAVRNRGNRLSMKLQGTAEFLKKVRHFSSAGSCPRCQELQETVADLEFSLKTKEREVNDRDEINDFLRKEIALSDLKSKVREELSPGELSSTKMDVLVQREQTIDQLQRLLQTALMDRDTYKTELDAKREELRSLGEQVELFKEAVTAKDHVVVDLTNKLFTLEHKGQVPTNPQVAMLPTSTHTLEEELQRMKEAVEAYRRQNQFLSSEILELNTIRAEDEEAFRALRNKYHDLEAQYCRIQSKHMILLQESQQPRMGVETGPSQELVTQMLQEAMGGASGEEPGSKERSNSYDRYGFSMAHATASREEGLGDDPLVNKARKLDQQAQRALEESSASQRAKWEVYMVTHGGGRELQRSEELKHLIRHGIPPAYRNAVWRWMVHSALGKDYQPGFYSNILEQHANQSSVAMNQIELDLLRTLPSNKYYNSADASGIGKLRRVLVAFSWYDTSVGYCQGLNRLAAIALLFLEEEDTFWCLVAIVHRLLPPDYYSRTLLGSMTDQRVLRDILHEKTPKLSVHLGVCDIDFQLITFNWFHTIYVDNLPVETMLRIWDTFLYEGSKVLFRFAVAIFRYNEEALMSSDSSIGVFNRLRTMCQDATDIERLVQIAFQDINPFRMSTIQSKRTQYRQKIQAELELLDSLRRQLPEPPLAQDKDSFTPPDFFLEENLCEESSLEGNIEDEPNSPPGGRFSEEPQGDGGEGGGGGGGEVDSSPILERRKVSPPMLPPLMKFSPPPLEEQHDENLINFA